MKQAACVAIALTVLAGAGQVHAARPELPTGPWKSIVVAVLPVTYFGASSEDLFVERPETTALRAEAARWHRGLELAFSGRDQVQVLGATELSERLTRSSELRRTRELAQERYALGIERWRALAPRDALTQLDRARELLVESDNDLVGPRLLADVEMHRGLALMDLGEVGPARIAFARMFVLDPTRRFERGYYGQKVEQELAGAARDVSQIPDPLSLVWPADRLGALARRLGVDVFALGLVLPRTSAGIQGAILEVGLFDAATGTFTRRESFALSDGALISGDLDRIVSAWHACALEAPRDLVRPQARPRWFVDFGYAHSVWLQHRRTRNYLHGPGTHIGVTFVPTPGLELWFKTEQRVTVSDANADLLDVFTTTHFALGAGLGVGNDGFRFSLRAGIEAAFSLADIGMTTDVDCKFFGADNDRCRGIFTAQSPAFWLGLDFAASVRIAPTRDFYLTLTTGTTIYALSGSLVSELNFPLYGSLGFGLPF